MSEPREDHTASDAPSGLWGGRFSGGMAPEMVRLNRSLDVDFRFWRHDVRGSRAWARALSGAEVISADEAEQIDLGLQAVATRLETLDPASVDDEDIHSLVERLLIEEVGDVGGKLHTGRSRNDQAATDVRLWGLEAASALDGRVEELARALHGLAAGSIDLLMPGYTHLQRAQPVRAAHWALSHVWPLVRDRDRIQAAVREASMLPLGAGAIAGCPFPVDREALRQDLGFRAITPNSMDAVSDRDWVASLLFAGAMIGVHVSRLSEDLVLFASSEFGFMRLSDGFSTGSSLMPQKRNPDVAELARGKSGRLVGNLVSMLIQLKGLPTGYNRDLQEDKQALYDTVDTLGLTLPAVTGAVRTAAFVPERLRAALDADLLATDLADYLVRRGVPFRTSHEVVGRLVRRAEEQACSLNELAHEVFAEEHAVFGADVAEVFDWTRSVDARAVEGGTERGSIETQLELAAAQLDRQGEPH